MTAPHHHPRDSGEAFPAGAPYAAGVEQPWPQGAAPPGPPGSGLPHSLEQPHPDHLQRFLELLGGLEHGRQGLLDRLWALIPALVDERNFLANATVLQVAPQSTGLVKITSVIACVPGTGGTNTAGTLQLGDWQLSLQAGVTVLGNVGMLLNASDLRQLTSASSGFLSLRLMGEQLPTRGVFAP